MTMDQEDIGSILITKPVQSFYEEPQSELKSTGFMAKLRSVLPQRSCQPSAIVQQLEPQEILQEPQKHLLELQEGNQQPYDKFQEPNEIISGLDDNSSKDSGQHVANGLFELISVQSGLKDLNEGFSFKADVLPVDQVLRQQESSQSKPFRFHHPSYQPPLDTSESLEEPKDFLHDTADSRTAQSQTDNEDIGEFIGFETDSSTELLEGERPSKSRFQRPIADWKAGLQTPAAIKSKAQAMINDLCVIERRVPWCKSEFYESFTLPQLFQDEIVDFVAYMSPTEKEHRLRMYVVARIAQIVASVWTDARVQVFGSFDTRLYLPSSDMDLVVFSESYGGSTSHRLLAKAIRSSGLALNGRVQVIPARIPIVKFTDSIGQFSIDISFNMDSGIKSAARVRDCISQHPALRPLMIVLKQFLYMRGLNEVFSGGLGSFGLCCMIMSFLQLHPLIQSGDIDQSENLNVLLIEFFDLYGRRFSYGDVGIKVRDDGSYYFKGAENVLAGSDRYSSLTIEDPEDITNDITRGSFNMRFITKAFSRAYDVVTGSFYELDERYVSEQKRLDDQHQRLSSDHRAWDKYRIRSILATIVDVQQSVFVHREYVKQKYDSIEELITSLLGLNVESTMCDNSSADQDQSIDEALNLNGVEEDDQLVNEDEERRNKKRIRKQRQKQNKRLRKQLQQQQEVNG